jgi:hypothetical protein
MDMAAPVAMQLATSPLGPGPRGRRGGGRAGLRGAGNVVSQEVAGQVVRAAWFWCASRENHRQGAQNGRGLCPTYPQRPRRFQGRTRALGPQAK